MEIVRIYKELAKFGRNRTLFCPYRAESPKDYSPERSSGKE